MAKADYSYDIHTEHKVIAIIDLDQGNMSVTNDIENVVKEIFQKEVLTNDDKFKIIYRDSEGIWDGYDNKDHDFIHLGCTNDQQAIEKIKLYYEKPQE